MRGLFFFYLFFYISTSVMFQLNSEFLVLVNVYIVKNVNCPGYGKR